VSSTITFFSLTLKECFYYLMRYISCRKYNVGVFYRMAICASLSTSITTLCSLVPKNIPLFLSGGYIAGIEVNLNYYARQMRLRKNKNSSADQIFCLLHRLPFYWSKLRESG